MGQGLNHQQGRATRGAAMVAALVAVGLLVGESRGQFVYTEQTRRVYARAYAANVGGPPPGYSLNQQLFVAPDFGPFDATASVSAAGTSGAQGRAGAEQVSSLHSGSLSAVGLSRVGSRRGSLSSQGNGTAYWDFIVSFSVAEPTWVHVSASMHTEQLTGTHPGTHNGLLELKWNSPAGPILALGGQIGWMSPPFSFSGPILLETGSYTVTFGVASSMEVSINELSESQAKMNLLVTVIPAPAGFIVFAAGLGVAALRRARPRAA